VDKFAQSKFFKGMDLKFFAHLSCLRSGKDDIRFISLRFYKVWDS